MSFTSTSLRAKIALILTLSISPLFAQQDLSTYGMTYLPQSLYHNPTADTDISFYLVLPMLHQNISLRNTGFSAYDILAEGTNVNDNIRNAVLDLRPEDALQVQTKSTLFDVGFSLRNKAMITLGSHLISSSQLSYPSQLIQQVYFTGQNYIGQTLSFEDFDAQSSLRVDHRIGLKIPFPKLNLVVGGALRYIQGISYTGIDQSFTNIGVQRIDDQTMDISLKAGLLTTGLPTSSSELNGFDGQGWGLDLGLRYDYKRWNFSASMAGGARIEWDIQDEYQINTNVRYTGVQWDNANPDEVSYPAAFDESFEIDTISSSRTITQTVESKYFLSARYALSKHQHLTFLYNSDPLTKKRLNTYGVQYNTRIMRSLGLHLGVLHNRAETSISAGFALRLLGFQLYTAVSNAGIIRNYYDTQEINISLGLNWTALHASDKKIERRKARSQKKEDRAMRKEEEKRASQEQKKEEKRETEEEDMVATPPVDTVFRQVISPDTLDILPNEEKSLLDMLQLPSERDAVNDSIEEESENAIPSHILPPTSSSEQGTADTDQASDESTPPPTSEEKPNNVSNESATDKAEE